MITLFEDIIYFLFLYIRIIVNNNKAKYIISNSIINNTLLFNKVYRRRNTKNKINVIRGIMPNIISITDPLFIGLDISLRNNLGKKRK